jgi:hypothetical protein
VTITLGFWSVAVVLSLLLLGIAVLTVDGRSGYGPSKRDLVAMLALAAIPVLWIGLLIGRLFS